MLLDIEANLQLSMLMLLPDRSPVIGKV